MSRFIIELAKPSDDVALQQLGLEPIRASSVVVSFRHHPSFFQSVRVQGPITQIGVARDTQTGEIVGWGIRSIRPAYINGRAANLGYLGGLWLHPAVRSGTLLARMFQSFYQLHRDRQTQLYLTTIPEQAYEIRQLFTSGRAALPHYDDLGRYYALGIRTPTSKTWPGSTLEVIQADSTHLQQIEQTLSQQGSRRQFFPCFIANDLLSGLPHLRDLRPRDFYLAIERGHVVGIAALWNQSAFRQLILEGYRGWRRLLQGLGQRVRKFLGKPPEYQPGQQIPYRFLSFLAVQDDRRDVVRALVGSLCQQASEAGAKAVLIGLHEKDPLLTALWQFRPYVHCRRLYLVYWEDGIQFRHSLEEMVPYVELATL
ncbi:MAG: hypothetical protein NZ602_10825 [Thermoguttaceae bacterium]|nr:hypothetical protein [Thermoguttaceae bacterium]MDW8038544.1 hypothetical protein [Thermoguttaceae bacterium]